MKLLIHDLTEKEFRKIFQTVPRDVMILSPSQNIHPCIGCFNCWVRTPSYCIIKDDYQLMSDVFSKISELIIVSKCCYGSYSPYVKNVIDRSLPYLLPFLEVRNGEMRHHPRYDNRFFVSAHFYGDMITPEEERIAASFVAENSKNFLCLGHEVYFHREKSALKGIAL